MLHHTIAVFMVGFVMSDAFHTLAVLPEKLPQQASVKQQVVKLQPKKATKQVNDIRVTAQQQPEKLPKQVLRLRSPLSRYLQSSIQANSSLRSCVNR